MRLKIIIKTNNYLPFKFPNKIDNDFQVWINVKREFLNAFVMSAARYEKKKH